LLAALAGVVIGLASDGGAQVLFDKVPVGAESRWGCVTGRFEAC